MKKLFGIFLLFLFCQQANAQHVYQIRADSVRIYNVCDTAELIIENRTRGVAGFLFNKNNGRTEFRRLQLETIGGNQIAITGQDTLDISTLPGIGGVDTIFRDGDYLKYVKRSITHSLYAPQPAYYVIPEGHAGYSPEAFATNQVAGFDAYNALDMPDVSDQALIHGASAGYFYAGHTVRYGSRGYQMAVNWNGELLGPNGAFIRNKDDTQGTWGAWRELMFKDYADNKFALKSHTHHGDYYTMAQMQTAGQAQVHWGNITGAPNFTANETLQTVTDRGNTTTHTIAANAYQVKDANTFLDKGSANTLRIVTPTGATEIGSQNGGWSHFETSTPAFYFAKPVHVNGELRRYNTDGYFDGYNHALHHGNGNGLKLWGGGYSFSVTMSDAGDGTHGGRISNLDSSPNDYNMYFRMNGNNRGFVFIPGNQVPTVQIDNLGISNTGWFRSIGNTGWYSQTYGGGWHMVDNTWIRSYGAKSILHDEGILRTDGTFQVGYNGAKMNVPNGGTPTIDGNTIWHAGNDGTGSGLDADLLDGKNVGDIIGNWGQVAGHATVNDFNAITRFGSTYINGGGAPPANGPGNGSLNQYYSWTYSLGSEYPVENYNLQMAMGRTGGGGAESGPYLYRRFKEHTVHTNWQKIAAGYADNAGALNGIESSRFIYGENGTGNNHISSANLNEIYKSGFYNGSGMVNAPTADWYNVIHSEHTNPINSYSNQIAQRFTGNGSEVNVFLRTQMADVWGPWREIWHTGNLAVSVTADADKVAQRDASGNLHATGFFQSSHSSLKQNIKTFTTAAIPLINQLVIKEFTYKSDSTNSIHFGIIADNSNWHFATKKQDRFDTNSSLAISLKAIQELSKENEQLKEQLNVLEERLKRLEQLLEKK